MSLCFGILSFEGPTHEYVSRFLMGALLLRLRNEYIHIYEYALQ